MLGLFATLNLGARALQAQQTAIEVTGQNLANVNNSAYARQRVQMQTSATVPTSIGPQGTGVEVVAIEQLRSDLLDGQVRGEASFGGYYDAQQSALQSAQGGLGEYLDINADGTTSTGAGASGLASKMSGFFDALQNVAASPESLSERQNLMAQAQSMTDTFNQIADHLSTVHDTISKSLINDVTSANQLLTQVASLNGQIANAENASGGTANDLRDLREQKLEELAKLVSYDTSTSADGSINISISGAQLVSGSQVIDTLQNSQSWLYTVNSDTLLNPTSGSIRGALDVRDGALQGLQNNLDNLARTIALRANSILATGYNLSGGNGNPLFINQTAATITVNGALVTDPSLFQASGAAGTPGDNTVALQLAQIFQGQDSWLDPATSTAPTYSGFYSSTVAQLGSALQNANTQVSDHEAMNNMLLQQRESVSGVSIDEEMTNLITFQKAYQASAKIVTTVDEMLNTVINMKR